MSKLLLEPEAVVCPICCSPIDWPVDNSAEGGQVGHCPACKSQHHLACWNFNHGCSTYGCLHAPQTRGYQATAMAEVHPLTGRRHRPRAAPRFTFRPAAPTRVRLPVHLGAWSWAATDGVTWGLLGGAAGLLIFSLPFWPAAWKDWQLGILAGIVLVAAGLGVFRGLHNKGAQDLPRLLYGGAGFAVLYVLAKFLTTFVPPTEQWRNVWTIAPLEVAAGLAGFLLGGLWLAIGPLLLRAALGGMLGLYLGSIVSFLWLETSLWSTEFSWGTIVLFAAGVAVLTLIKIPLHNLLRATVTAGPGFALMWAAHASTPETGTAWHRTMLLLIFLALPLAGFVQRSGASASSLPASRRASITPREVLQLAGDGILRAAFAGLVFSLTLLIGTWLAPLVTNGADALPQLPVLRMLSRDGLLQIQGITESGPPAILSGMFPVLGQFRLPLQPFYLAVLIAGAAFFAVGRLAQGGLVYMIYRFTRALALALCCCLAALLLEQLLELVLENWSVLQSLQHGLSWIRYLLPAVAIFLGLIFALVYTKDPAPLLLTCGAFVLWFAQVLLLSGGLAFIGGTVGRWITQATSASASSGLVGSSRDAPPQAGPLIGFGIGLALGMAYFLTRWVRREMGRLVTGYRRLVLQYNPRLDRWTDRLLQFQEPWWAIAAFTLASGVLMWQSVQALGWL